MASNQDFLSLPDGWTCKSLINCTEDGNISYGIVQPGMNVESGVPIIRVNNIGDNRIDVLNVLKVEQEIESKYQRTRLSGGEVLLTLVGSTGQTVIVPDELKGWNVARAIAVIKIEKSIGAEWINICLQTQETQNFLNSRANTTVQKTLNLKDVRNIPILIPPLKIKKFIEKTVISLNKKIELNRQMNETLEAMAQALFKSWFVDFDPVIDNALAAGKPIPDELSERAEQRKAVQHSDNQAVRALFPDEFVLTEEMGWIPKGWSLECINEFGSVICGKTPPTKDSDNYDGNIPFITIPDMHGKVYVTNAARKLSPKGAQTQPKQFLPAGSICVSCIATVGLVVITKEPSQTNQQINSLIPKNTENTLFLYESLSRIGDLIQSSGSGGSVFLNLSKGKFEKLKILCPSEKLQKKYDETVTSIFEAILLNQERTETLVILRDTLLPKLLSGELRIPDAAALVEDI